MPGMVRMQTPAALVPVRVVSDVPLRQEPPARVPTAHPGNPAATIEVVLRNGRTLRVGEAIGPEVLGRLAAALDA